MDPKVVHLVWSIFLVTLVSGRSHFHQQWRSQTKADEFPPLPDHLDSEENQDYVPDFDVVRTRSGHAQSDLEVIEDDEYLKAIYDDIQSHKQSYRSPYEKKCYPQIGCFSPTINIIKVDYPPYPPDTIDTKFRLYTRKNREAEQVMDYTDKSTFKTTLFKPEVPVIFIIHGFSENGLGEWILNMKNILLEKKDVNIITVDWGKGAKFPRYSQAIVNAELVSRQAARVLTLLKELRGYDIKQTHMIGFSLGAQLSGFTAKVLKKAGESVARITGLDPAGPDFELTDETVHLSYLDANYVDVVHTNGGSSKLKGYFGIFKAIGHVDFYPNGGKTQPGCALSFSFSCSHQRAYRLFTESITSDCEFSSNSCKSYDEFKEGRCSNGKAAIFGYHSQFGAPRGSYYFFTNGKSPYCIKKSL